ncbi:MAG: glycosyltransferase family 4 protein [Sphingomonadales bacterium]|nr:glycosyltransferase family 4 protein [Sphingomonadales bacterium]
MKMLRGTAVRIAYLVNRYPAVSHSFIRREIIAVEAAGLSVIRFSIRAAAGDLPDPRDREEAARTTGVLAQGLPALALASLRMAVTQPRRFASALGLAGRALAAEPRRGWRQLAYLAEACWLAARLDGVAHIHAHFGTNPAAVARLLGRLSGLPYSFTVHGPDEFDAPRALDLGGKIKDARAVVAISSYGRSQLMRWSDPADWRKIAVIRCGVDAMFLDEQPLAPRSAPQLCCVARLSAQKGLPLLIEAAARLAAMGRAFQLVLVGDGEMRAELEGMIAERGLAGSVTIAGQVGAARVREIVASARAMVLPSFAEGLPVVIMEALALRTPVIVTAIAGTPELVDAECGWVIPAGSVEALTEAMAAALDASPEALAARGEVGRQRVLRLHDAGRNGRALADLFGASP